MVEVTALVDATVAVVEDERSGLCDGEAALASEGKEEDSGGNGVDSADF